MSDYDLSLTGAQIDAALSKVHNADSTPTNGSQNMITSDAVHDSLSGYVSGQLVTDFSTVNNTTVPTTQAVSDFVASNTNVAYFTHADGQTTRNNSYTSQYHMTETSDPGNFASVSGGTITLSPGCYSIIGSGLYTCSFGFASHWDIRYIAYTANNHTSNDHTGVSQFDVVNRGSNSGSPGDSEYKRLSAIRGINTFGTSRDIYTRVDIVGGASGSGQYYETLFWKDVTLTIIKHL